MEGAGFSLVSKGTGAEESQGCGLASLTPGGGGGANSSAVTQQVGAVTQQVGRLVEGLSWVHKEKGYFEGGSRLR